MADDEGKEWWDVITETRELSIWIVLGGLVSLWIGCIWGDMRQNSRLYGQVSTQEKEDRNRTNKLGETLPTQHLAIVVERWSWVLGYWLTLRNVYHSLKHQGYQDDENQIIDKELGRFPSWLRCAVCGCARSSILSCGRWWSDLIQLRLRLWNSSERIGGRRKPGV